MQVEDLKNQEAEEKTVGKVSVTLENFVSTL